MNPTKFVVVAGACLLALGGVSVAASDAIDISATLKESFAERGIAKLDRIEQSPLQKICSQYAMTEMPKALRDELEKNELARVKYPSDGQWLGDWKRGEQVAQSGRGMQFSDTAQTVNGANCYACHELSKQEMSFGNIGPSLHHYGKLRGNSEPILKYTWGKLWNAHAFSACTAMPRFGEAGILTEAQLKDVMALLLDPESPVNK